MMQKKKKNNGICVLILTQRWRKSKIEIKKKDSNRKLESFSLHSGHAILSYSVLRIAYILAFCYCCYCCGGVRGTNPQPKYNEQPNKKLWLYLMQFTILFAEISIWGQTKALHFICYIPKDPVDGFNHCFFIIFCLIRFRIRCFLVCSLSVWLANSCCIVQ